MDLLVHLLSEVDDGMKIKYLTSVMICNAKAQDVVTDTRGIREISHSSQTDAFSWNGWTKCEQIYTEQI